MKNIAVFCGSNLGNSTSYQEQAISLIKELHHHQMTLVYGGANVGLMGVIANTMLALGGKVIGVLPTALADIELAHPHLTELHIVSSLQERKNVINQLSDGFITLPGGAGSMDEFFEVFTLSQLGYHKKPYAFFDVGNYYEKLFEFLNHTVEQGFMKSLHRDTIIQSANPATLISAMLEYKAPNEGKWIQ